MDVLNFVDQNNNKIQLGDIVEVNKGKMSKFKENKFIFLFCIPQHRFGFVFKSYYDKVMENNQNGGYDFEMFPEPFVTNMIDMQFYYTPKNLKTIKLIGS